jgi:hypothetical protein
MRLTVPLPRGGRGHQLPYMASVLAELRAEEQRRETQVKIAWFSLAVAIAAVAVSVFTAIFGK